MKLNTNNPNLILLSTILLLSSISFITSEPTEVEVVYNGKFSNIKHKKITLRLEDELSICKGSELIDVGMRMFDHDKILRSINGKYPACEYYRAVKTGKFEILFKRLNKGSLFDFSISTILKEMFYAGLLLDYKTWDVVVSE